MGPVKYKEAKVLLRAQVAAEGHREAIRQAQNVPNLHGPGLNSLRKNGPHVWLSEHFHTFYFI